MAQEQVGTYLGDGLYAEWQGFQVRLFTLGADQQNVYLEPDMLERLVAYVQREQAK